MKKKGGKVSLEVVTEEVFEDPQPPAVQCRDSTYIWSSETLGTPGILRSPGSVSFDHRELRKFHFPPHDVGGNEIGYEAGQLVRLAQGS